jgi:hypothetical protein
MRCFAAEIEAKMMTWACAIKLFATVIYSVL